MVTAESEKIREEAIRFYRGYIDRNRTFEAFADDVNTLGGNFMSNPTRWISTNKKQAIVTDEKHGLLIKIPLKEIYQAVKAPQLTLF